MFIAMIFGFSIMRVKSGVRFCCSVAYILHHHCKKPQNNIFHINKLQNKKSNLTFKLLTLNLDALHWCVTTNVCLTNASWHFAKHYTHRGMGMTYALKKKSSPW